MRSFKNFNGIPNPHKSTPTPPTPPPNAPSSAEDLTKRLAEAFDGKSSSTMLKSILTEAEKSKRAGTLSNAEIDAFYAQFAPMLNPAQQSALKGIIEKLKKL